MDTKNRYYLMRHGQSEANVEGKIVSHPDIGCASFGLTHEGKQQILASLNAYDGPNLQQVYCSDFLRTKETARLVTKALSLPEAINTPSLRERFFGNWDGQSDRYYEQVWQKDAQHPSQLSDHVESAEDVFKRVMEFIETLESHHQDQTILLVAHGDVLQILRTAWFNLAPHEHRKLPNIHTAEIVPLGNG
ncbi:histidine phosphatase family protein [Maribrevibacterium harenarium]|nr:histidine phosphatase family protein [Maribrevibacterium harenarium]